MSFVCEECRQLHPPHREVEERYEFRIRKSGARHATIANRRLCRPCADKRIAELRPPKKLPNQELWEFKERQEAGGGRG